MKRVKLNWFVKSTTRLLGGRIPEYILHLNEFDDDGPQLWFHNLKEANDAQSKLGGEILMVMR